MNLEVVFASVVTVVSPLFVTALFERKRGRTGWAKAIFCILAVTGPIVGLAQLALIKHWFALQDHIITGVRSSISCTHGIMLGLILALAISGQLVGTKRKPAE